MSTATARREGPVGLSVDAIVDVAVGISEKEGFEAISMRRLAAEFDVTAMALYGYIDTKHHLLELVADRYAAELDLGEDDQAWNHRLGTIFHSLYDLLLEQPVLAHVITQQTVEGPGVYRLAEVVIGLLRDAGFGDEEAVEIFKVLTSYTFGMALSRRPRVATKRELAKRARRFRDAEGYPNLNAVADRFVSWQTSDFERGLTQLITAQAGRRTR